MSTNPELADTLPPPRDEADSLADVVIGYCRNCDEGYVLADGEDGYCPECVAHEWGSHGPPHCPLCNGSGEGMVDGSRCSACHGSGVVKAGREDYEDD